MNGISALIKGTLGPSGLGPVRAQLEEGHLHKPGRGTLPHTKRHDLRLPRELKVCG